MTSESGPPPNAPKPGVVKQTLHAAREGVIGNAAWGLLVLVALGGAAFLKGTVPAVVFLVSLILAVSFGGFVAAAAGRRTTKLEVERDEARKRADECASELGTQRREHR